MNRRRTGSLALALLLIAGGCKKDTYTTVPQVTVKSISPSTVVTGNVIEIKGSFTDLEGDVDSALIAYKWFNGPVGTIQYDTFRMAFDDIGLPAGTRRADLSIQFEYNADNNPNIPNLPGVSLRDTTAAFGLLLIDKAKNRSNYSESPTIRLKKQ